MTMTTDETEWLCKLLDRAANIHRELQDLEPSLDGKVKYQHERRILMDARQIARKHYFVWEDGKLPLAVRE